MRLKKHLIFTKHLKSQNYQIFVYNKKAYLVGRTSGSDEKELLIKTLEGVLYVTDVVIYIT
jgi:osmotically-inducible protein OsmY